MSDNPNDAVHAGQLPMVGIGASAGGLEALQEFFNHLPPDTGAAFVLVQHLSPDFKSLMYEILARHTSMPIERLTERASLQPNRLFLAPPRSNVRVAGNQLIVESEEPALLYRPIDQFFESMAAAQPENCVAIVLSGTGSDGAAGVTQVKRAGGVVLVQDPRTAQFDGMPNAAIATGTSDAVLAPAAMAGRLTTLLSAPLASASRAGQPGLTPAQVDRVRDLLREQGGIDLTHYRPGTIQRRIQRRIEQSRLGTADDYMALLAGDPDEVQALARDCLIHVTQFFRNKEAWDALSVLLRRRFVQDHDRAEPFRVWVAGCSTGQEAYSIAACIEQILRDTGSALTYKIFATDLEEESVQTASAGRYPETAAAEMPAALAELLFRRHDGQLVVNTNVRNNIVFAKHDVLRDPPFPRADLICCRNLMIYLEPAAQERALMRFHFALRPNGLLLLGAGESVDALADQFNIIDARWRIFEKRPGGRLLVPAVEARPQLAVTRPIPTLRARRDSPRDLPVFRAAQKLVEMFADAGAILGESGEVMFTFGDVSRWLTIPRGQISTNLIDLVSSAAAESLAFALRQARNSNDCVHVGRIPALYGGQEGDLDLLHLPSTDGQPGLDVLLVGRRSGAAATSVSAEISLDEVARRHISQLERELHATRESLQVTIEELETTNEEMQSVNEELMASNEELQSTNEELHAVNEELYSVNTEHQQRIGNLTKVSADFENVLAATSIGLVILDHELAVRRFTPAVETALPLRSLDEGRSIAELATHLLEVDLATIARTVLRTSSVVERQVMTRDGRLLMLKACQMPLGGVTGNGVVFTFVPLPGGQVPLQGGATRALAWSAWERGLHDSLWMVDRQSLRRLHTAAGPDISPVGFDRNSDPLAWLGRVHPDDRARVEKAFLASRTTADYDEEYRIIQTNGGIRWLHDRCHGAVPGEGGTEVLVGITTDVTERVLVDQERAVHASIHATAFEAMPVPLLLVALDDAILWSNPAARAALGDTATAGSRWAAALANEVSRSAWQATMAAAIKAAAGAGSGASTTTCELVSSTDQHWFVDLQVALAPAQAGRAPFLVVQWRDRADEMAREQDLVRKTSDLETEATTDPLTGLLNRRGFERELMRRQVTRRRDGESWVAALIDCDWFKQINDRFGHATGDRVLRAVAERTRSMLRPGDVVARVGGDEFLVLFPDTRLAEGAHVASRLRRAMTEEPLDVGGTKVPLSISVGVVPVPDPVHGVSDLLLSGSTTLKRSKQAGRNRVSFDDGQGFADLEDGRRQIEELLTGRWRVVVQSMHRIADGEAYAGELLARGPNASIERLFELAGEQECIGDVDMLCLSHALRTIREHPRDEHLHVNLMPQTLLGPKADAAITALGSIRKPEQVTLEFSEQQFVGDTSKLRERLQPLRKAGFTIGVDHLGFHRSGLETLLSLEPDVIKLDRQMVADVDRDADKRRLLERGMRLMAGVVPKVVAVGVERESQRLALQEMGCLYGQGFLWSKPD